MVRYERYVYEPELIAAILDQCEIVSAGFMDQENAYVVPMNYGYRATEEGLRIYVHTGKTGYKLKLMEKNDRVCCAFYSWQNFPDHPYRGRVHDFMSVMAFGRIKRIDPDAQKEEFKEGLKALFEKNQRTGCKNPKGIAGIHIYVIACDWNDVTGKSEHPLRRPEDAVFKDVRRLPEDERPYEDDDLYEKRDTHIRKSQYLGYTDEAE